MVRLLRWLAVLVVASLAAAPAAPASDPWLDPGFGVGGVARYPAFGAVGAESAMAAVAPDGDTVVVLQPALRQPDDCCFAAVGGVALARLAPDGTLRGGFGTGGVVQPARVAAPGSAEAVVPLDVAVDAAGRPLAVGMQQIVPIGFIEERPVVQRRTATGGRDPAFGTGGIAPLPVPAPCKGSGIAVGYGGIAAMADGRVLAVGSCLTGPGSDHAILIARLLSDGAPDPTFGIGGALAVPAPGFGRCCSVALRRYADGRIAVALGANRTGALRLLPDGTPDPAFGAGGLVSLADAAVGAVLPLADGGMLIARGPAAGLARLVPTGELVGTGGPAVPGDCASPTIVDLGRSNARVVVALACGTAVRLVAVDDAGAPDPGWGAHPTRVATASVDDGPVAPRRVLVPQPGGALAVAGVGGGTGGGRVARLGPTGAVDAAFGSDGVRALPLEGRLFNLSGSSAVRDAAGRVLAAMRVDARFAGDEGAVLVTRLRTDGSLDGSFGGDGHVLVEGGGWRAGRPLFGGESISDPAIVPRADGGVDIVARWEHVDQASAEQGLLLARLRADGRPDPAVAADGRRLLLRPEVSRSVRPLAVSAVAAPRGGLDVGFEESTPDGDVPTLARIRADGTLDRAFGSGGIARVAGGSARTRVHALPGGARLLEIEGRELVRLLPDGSVDRAWAAGAGRVALSELTSATAVGPDGSIAVGVRVVAGFDGSRVVRLRPDGTRQGGFRSRPLADMRLLSIAIAGRRTYLLVQLGDDRATRRLVRLRAGGAVDGDFGGDGRVVPEAGARRGFGQGPVALLVAASDRVVAVDTTYDGPRAPNLVRAVRVLPAVLSVAGARPGVTLATTVRLRWAGIAGPYRLERREAPARSGFGAWTTTAVGARTSAVVRIGRGATTCVRVRPARGATSAPACFAAPLPARALRASSGWRTTRAAGAYAGAVRSASRRGATLSVPRVAGRTFAVVATRCRGCGTVEVRLAGRLLRRISLAGPFRRSAVIPLGTFATVRSGALELRVTSSGRPVRIEGLAAWRDDA